MIHGFWYIDLHLNKEKQMKKNYSKGKLLAAYLEFIDNGQEALQEPVNVLSAVCAVVILL